MSIEECSVTKMTKWQINLTLVISGKSLCISCFLYELILNIELELVQ